MKTINFSRLDLKKTALWGFIIVVMAISNPSMVDFQQEIINGMKARLQKEEGFDEERFTRKIPMLHRALKRENFILFSTVKMQRYQNSHIVGFGVFGQVFLFLD